MPAAVRRPRMVWGSTRRKRKRPCRTWRGPWTTRTCESGRRAAVSLGQIGPRAEEAVGPLIKSLGAADPVLRRQAAAALGRIGPVARQALTALRKAQRDEARIVREAANEAIKGIEG